MSNHSNWHDQQGQYSAPPQPRHHPNMDPYAGPSPSSQQAPPYSNPPHVGAYPQAHLPPPLGRQPPQQQWTQSGSQDFGGPSPSNSATRSSGNYPSAFDAPPSSIANTNSPMRQHGTHASPYASQSPYAPPPSHGSSDPQMHPGPRGGMPPQYDYSSSHGPSSYAHPHHPSSQSQNQQQQPPPPPPGGGGGVGGGPQHHSHPSQQHWNAGPIPSVLQPQSLQSASGPGGLNRGGPGGPPSHPMDRPYGVSKQEDDMDDDEAGGYDDYDTKGKGRAGDAAQTANKGTSDFVKKLFSMLDDKAYESVVAWSPSGESFIVKDMNDFTKHVLPRNFRHSNFASFVRQLNKYDFHKVKNPEDGSGTVGEHVWEFQHPDFIRGREDLLENVKRKIPAKKKPNLKGGLGADGDRDDSPTIPLQVVDGGDKSGDYADLKAQISNLTTIQDQMQNHILALTKQYQGVIGEMLTFQRNMVQQDQLMQNLIQYLMNLEQDRPTNGAGPASSFLPHPGAASGNANDGSFLAPGNSYEHTSFAPHMNDMRHGNDGGSSLRNAGTSATAGPHSVGSSGPSVEASSSTNAASSTRLSGMTSAPSTAAPLSPKSVASPMDGNNGKTPELSQQQQQHNPTLAPMILRPPHVTDDADTTGRNPSLSTGLRAFMQSRTGENNSSSSSSSAAAADQPPSKLDRTTSFDSSKSNLKDTTDPVSKKSLTPTGEAGNYLRVRRSTLVPGWSVPPRVLLVDDDEVCRRLSSKFLQVFGCSIDYAVDGMSAVNKMNLEKYDLVLMDIVMPNLDGVSATSLIRQFDPKTPIISMTSNSGPSELINYMSSGMTDILQKPFTKEGLLNMLEKHLLHLKAVQREHRQSGDMGQVQNVIKSITPGASTTSGASVQSNSTSAAGAGASAGADAGASAGADAGAAGSGGPTPSSTVSNGANNNNNNNNNNSEEASLNPLAGMGFTDEEYVAMLQNLISAGTDDELGGMLDTLSSPSTTKDSTTTPGGGRDPRTSPFPTTTTTTTTAGFKRSGTDDFPNHHHHHHHHHHNQAMGLRNVAGESNKRGRFGEIS